MAGLITIKLRILYFNLIGHNLCLLNFIEIGSSDVIEQTFAFIKTVIYGPIHKNTSMFIIVKSAYK